MKLDKLQEKNLLYCKPFENNIFSDKPNPAVVEFKTKRGIKGVHYHSEKGEKNLIIAPAMGRHVHDQRICAFFSAIGFNTTTFDYAGTYDSREAGEFLPSAKGKLSIQEDLEEIIDSIHKDEPVEILGPCFGGAAAVQAAAERPKQINAIYLFAPMLYGSPKKPYKKDKSMELGEFKTYPRYRGTERDNWLEEVWKPLIKGKTSLNAYKAIPKLANAGTRIYGVACEHDNLINYETLDHFGKELCSKNFSGDMLFYIYEDKPDRETGHFGHYRLEYAPGAISSFCRFIGKKPEDVLALKKKIDMEFAEKAKGKIPVENPKEEENILKGIKLLAATFYHEDKEHLKQVANFETSRIKQFALGMIKGILL